MAGVLFNTAKVENHPLYGKHLEPIKMLITAEAKNESRDEKILKVLFNMDKSNNFAESVIGQSEFGTFMAKEEGQSGENDTIQGTFDNVIEHIEFSKVFTMTEKMAEDAKVGIGANTGRAAQAFMRAWKLTRIQAATAALANATALSTVFNKGTIHLTAGDKVALFSNAHPFYTPRGKKNAVQSNNYWGDMGDTAKVEAALASLAVTMRNFKDENGDPMGYVADTIILPGNRAKFERMVKTVVGSERTAGSSNNDINTQYGGYNIIVLPYWQSGKDEFLLMSSEANKNLGGNLFFDRAALSVRADVDHKSGNLEWVGRGRFGIGFGAWKHILRAESATNAVSGATAIA